MDRASETEESSECLAFLSQRKGFRPGAGGVQGTPAPFLGNMVMFQHGEFPSICSGWWKSPVSPRRRCSKTHRAELVRNDPVSSGPVLNQHPTCCIRRCQALRAAVKGQEVGWGDNTFQMGYKSELFIASCCKAPPSHPSLLQKKTNNPILLWQCYLQPTPQSPGCLLCQC